MRLAKPHQTMADNHPDAIYLPDWSGVRLEDMVLVQEDGVEVLSRAGKEAVIIR